MIASPEKENSYNSQKKLDADKKKRAKMEDIVPKAPTFMQYVMFGAETGLALYFYCWWSLMLAFFVKAEHILRFEDPRNNGAKVQEFLMQCAGKASDACDYHWISERLCSFVREILGAIQGVIHFLEIRGQFQKGSGWVSLIRMLTFSYHAFCLILLWINGDTNK